MRRCGAVEIAPLSAANEIQIELPDDATTIDQACMTTAVPSAANTR